MKVFFWQRSCLNRADVIDYDLLDYTFLCSASVEQCCLFHLLENHVRKFVHSLKKDLDGAENGHRS